MSFNQQDPLRRWIHPERRPKMDFVPFVAPTESFSTELLLAEAVRKWGLKNLTEFGQWTMAYFHPVGGPDEVLSFARIGAEYTYGVGLNMRLELEKIWIQITDENITLHWHNGDKKTYARHYVAGNGVEIWVLASEYKQLYHDRKIFEEGSCYPAKLDNALTDLDRRCREWIHATLRHGGMMDELHRFPPLTDSIAQIHLRYGQGVTVMGGQDYMSADTPVAEFTKVRQAFERLKTMTSIEYPPEFVAAPIGFLADHYYQFVEYVGLTLQFNGMEDLKRRFEGTVEMGRRIGEKLAPVPPPEL